MFNNFKFVAGLAVSVLVGCSGSASRQTLLDGGATKATFVMKVSSTAAAARLNPRMIVNADGSLTLGDSGVTLTSASVNVKEVKLKLPEGISCEAAGFVAGTNVSCENESDVQDDGSTQVESEVSIKGPFIFDLVTGVSTPDIGNITLPSGVYKKIKISFEESKVDGPMKDYTLIASGNFVDAAAASHSISLKLKFSEEIKVEDTAGMEVAETMKNAIHANLNVDAWLTGINLRQCVTDGNLSIDTATDTLFIDDLHKGSGACENVDGLIKENIKKSFEMENDESKDKSGSDSSSGK